MIKADWQIKEELEKDPEFCKIWDEYVRRSDELAKISREFRPDPVKRMKLEDRKRKAKDQIDAMIREYRKDHPET
ncbi:MAG: hypothetical protein Q7R73_00625 [bacterium]|nr:hypothetical protein [bacterium]